MRKVICTLLIQLVMCGVIIAQWSTNPAINTPVSTAANNQMYPGVVSDGSGGAIITWYDLRGGSTYDIYVQRIDAGGVVQWTTNGVAVSAAASSQINPTLISDGAGGAIITWQDFRNGTDYDIYAQRINASGVVQWTADGVAISNATGGQDLPTITSDGAGGAIITWRDIRNGTDYDVYAQRVDATGTVQWTTDGVAISTPVSSHQINPALVGDGAGGAIITWSDSRPGSVRDIYAQRIDAGGAVQWTANGVVICAAAGDQTTTAIISDEAGGAIMTWQDARTGSDLDIYAQRINGGGLVQWMVDGVAISTTVDDQRFPALTSDGAGGAIITYDSRSGPGFDIYSQRIDASGAVQWTANGVAISTATMDQDHPTIASDGAGGAIITWDDLRSFVSGTDIYAQRINASGSVQWTSNGVAISVASSQQQIPTIVSAGAGGAIVTWHDIRSGTNYDIYAQRINMDGTLGTPPAPTTVTAVLPSINALNISPSTTIQVTFSGPILPTSFNDLTSFIVSGSVSGRHLGTFGFSGGNTVVTFTPTVPFKQGEAVIVDISINLLNVISVPIVPFVYSFSINASVAPGTFTGRVDYPVGSQPRGVFVHDLDSDGDADIVTANGGPYSVSILKNNGDATFAANVEYPTGGYSTSVYVNDLDGDGDGDLAVANAYDGYVVSILKNNGDGTFAAKVDYPIGSGSNAVFVSDLDGDGDGDVVTANGGSTTFSVLTNNGDGTLQPKVDYPTSVSGTPNYLSISDVDGDGDGDVLVGNQSGVSSISVFKNNGNATFAAGSDYPTGPGELGSLTVNDVDGDGDGDVVVSNQTNNIISVLKNNSDGTFTAPVDYPTGGNPAQIFISDIDGDGDGDLAVADNTSQAVSVLKNNGDGTFAPKKDYVTASGPVGIFVCDFDGDGDGDIVTSNLGSANVTVLLNDFILYALTVNTIGSGSVTKSPDQPSYLEGSSVQLEAIPALGYQFYEWSGDASGSLNPMNIVMDNNKDVTATFIIDPVYEISYRTATYNDWATAVDSKGKYKAEKRKSDKVHLKFNVGAPANATGFTLKFTMDVIGVVTIGKTKTIQLGDSVLNTNVATFTGLTIAQGDTFQFDGYGLKGKIAGVKVIWQTSPKPTTQTITGFKINTPKLTMPNLHNVGSELFPGGYGQAGAYFMSGLLVGIPQGLKGGNSVIHPKYKDVQKSLVKFSHGIPQFHADSIRCLDTLPINHKPISKQLKSMPPDKYSNRLFAELLTLKLNVAASITEKFPAGLGELTFFDKSEPTNPFNGQLINTVVQKADTMISCLPLTSKLPVPTTADLYSVLQKINGAFAGAVDTISFASKTKLTGVTQLIDVPFLRKTPGLEPTVVFSGDVIEQVPEIFGLQQNYPNPFNPSTTIGVELRAVSTISLRIYNLLGQEIAEVIRDETLDEGIYEFEFSAGNLPSGVYLYHLTGQSADDEGVVTSLSDMKKMILIK